MDFCWYLQLLTNQLEQGFQNANVAGNQMSAAWKLPSWKELRAPLTVSKFLFQWEGLSRKYCTSVSAVEKKKKPTGAELTPTSSLMQFILESWTINTTT